MKGLAAGDRIESLERNARISELSCNSAMRGNPVTIIRVGDDPEHALLRLEAPQRAVEKLLVLHKDWLLDGVKLRQEMQALQYKQHPAMPSEDVQYGTALLRRFHVASGTIYLGEYERSTSRTIGLFGFRNRTSQKADIRKF